jgi:hypothetical protein
MDKQILAKYAPTERITILRDTADKKEVFTYPKALDVDEVTHLKDEFTQNAIKMAREDEAKKDFMESFKAKVKPLKIEMTLQMRKIRSKVDEVTEDVFLISDQEEKTMGYYNVKGFLVYERPLMPDERQLSLVSKEQITAKN